jgi:4-carboxymuconolactone decarboxylase
MTRIPYADPATLSEQTRRALEIVPPLNVFRLLAGADAAFPAFLRLTGGLWNDAELSPRRRELVILHVARLTGAEYEWHQHVAVARLCEISDAEIELIGAGRVDGEPLPAEDRVLLAMTEVIVRRERAGDELLAATRRVLSDRELLELHLVVAIYAGLAALMTNLDLDLDEQLGAQLLGTREGSPRLGERLAQPEG